MGRGMESQDINTLKWFYAFVLLFLTFHSDPTKDFWLDIFLTYRSTPGHVKGWKVWLEPLFWHPGSCLINVPFLCVAPSDVNIWEHGWRTKSVTLSAWHNGHRRSMWTKAPKLIVMSCLLDLTGPIALLLDDTIAVSAEEYPSVFVAGKPTHPPKHIVKHMVDSVLLFCQQHHHSPSHPCLHGDKLPEPASSGPLWISTEKGVGGDLFVFKLDQKNTKKTPLWAVCYHISSIVVIKVLRLHADKTE